ncbi:MAG: hypothetical protein HWN65_18610 [Candidatus Helarchaeota archaeon]|nr:hypothetical protein [Candidatus Helarchaeota archaeon]
MSWSSSPSIGLPPNSNTSSSGQCSSPSILVISLQRRSSTLSGSMEAVVMLDNKLEDLETIMI